MVYMHIMYVYMNNGCVCHEGNTHWHMYYLCIMANICSFPRWQGGGRYALCVCVCICSYLNWYACIFHFLWKSSWLITAVSFCPDFKTLVKAHSPAFAICLIKCICHLPIPPRGCERPSMSSAAGDPPSAGEGGTWVQNRKGTAGYSRLRACLGRLWL